MGTASCRQSPRTRFAITRVKPHCATATRSVTSRSSPSRPTNRLSGRPPNPNSVCSRRTRRRKGTPPTSRLASGVSSKLTTVELMNLNKALDVDKQDAKVAATAWLKKVGIVK